MKTKVETIVLYLLQKFWQKPQLALDWGMNTLQY